MADQKIKARMTFHFILPAVKAMYTKNFSWWNKISFQVSCRHSLNINVTEAVNNNCTVIFLVSFLYFAFELVSQGDWKLCIVLIL